ncbi:secondary thiamine-phosphate synthase enzyme YjbQ [Methylophilaceae bacterium]|jgi:secondary thiamine-phosphate synthase enzyme|nr:secondary thiamine-phosphate synthase enzyme YjbQ [Methylophilaceae bacterium]|tara:strand:- start:3318 stop:3737 length:420 start_codon:yes stop_codon:yes gene_type:complete
MKQSFDEITLHTQGRGLYDITLSIVDWIDKQEIQDGLLTLLIQHTSASLLLNENYDSDVQRDIESFFSRLVKDGDPLFTHTIEGDDDMPAHIRTALTQINISVPVRNKKLLLGQWQGVYIFEHRYSEFNRKVKIHLIGN